MDTEQRERSGDGLGTEIKDRRWIGIGRDKGAEIE
jgi:hypothetical protein